MKLTVLLNVYGSVSQAGATLWPPRRAMRLSMAALGGGAQARTQLDSKVHFSMAINRPYTLYPSGKPERRKKTSCSVKPRQAQLRQM